MLQSRKHLDQEKTAYAQLPSIKGSVQKLSVMSSLIKGLKAEEALLQLQFCKKRGAESFYRILNSAISNAENNHNLDIDNLYVSEVLVDKALMLKRFSPQGRGKMGIRNKPYSRITVFVSEGSV